MAISGLAVLLLSFLGIVISLLATLDQFQPFRDVVMSFVSVKSTGAPQYKMFTKEELSQYSGKENSQVYLAILGDVFDVTKGRRHYGEGGGYSFFAGKDGSRAYVTGDFTDEGLIEDLSGLSLDDMLGVEDWNQFYKKDYKHIGRLVGHFYDENGQPTDALKQFESRLLEAKKVKLSDEDDRKRFPPCNFESRQGDYRRIWCSNLSGGIQRDWVGVPRQYFQAGKKDPRCACVKDFGAQSGADPNTDNNNRGDLDNPSMKLYKDCEPTSFQCFLDP